MININKRDYDRLYKEKNKEDLKRKSKEYRDRTKGEKKKYLEVYNVQNAGKIKEGKRRFYEDNKEDIKKEKRKKYKTNKKPITEQQRIYNKNYHFNKYQNDIQYRLRTRLCNRFNNAIRRYKGDGKVIVSRDKNINYKAILEHLRPLPLDMGNYHIDHIIPLRAFDLTNSEHMSKAWDPVNLQVLSKSENERKGNDIDFDKYPEQRPVYVKLRLKSVIYKHL